MYCGQEHQTRERTPSAGLLLDILYSTIYIDDQLVYWKIISARKGGKGAEL